MKLAHSNHMGIIKTWNKIQSAFFLTSRKQFRDSSSQRNRMGKGGKSDETNVELQICTNRQIMPEKFALDVWRNFILLLL